MILWNLRSQRMSRQHNKQAHCMLSTEVQRSVRLNKKKKSTKHFPVSPMKPSNVWHGHSIRRSLPAGTARKASVSLLHGRRSRLTSPAKKNRKFPLGNSLSYLSCVDFAGCVLRGAPCFCFVIIFLPILLEATH